MTIQEARKNPANLAASQACEMTHATEPVWIAFCCLMIILALVGGVGLVSGLVLHHLVRTLPLWVGVALGFRRSPASGWIGLPLFLFWLVLMGLIWLQLLGYARVLTMHFSPLEIGMTIVVGIGSVVGIAMFWRLKSALSSTSAGALFIMLAVMQWLCFRAGVWPAIALR